MIRLITACMAALCLAVFVPHLVLAAAIGAVSIDISPFVQLAVSAASMAILGAIPPVLLWINKHLKLSADGLMAQRVAGAVNAAAQLAIAEIGSIAAHNRDPSIKSAAIANAINKLSPGAQAAINALGLTPDVIAQRVDGEITKEMAPAIAVNPVLTVSTAVPTPAATPAT